MDKDELAKRLMVTFLEEVDEHVRALNEGFLSIEKNPGEAERKEILKKVFRSAHSLKGASRAVNVQVIEDACHHLEDILTGIRDEKFEFTPDLYAVLFKTVDGIDEVSSRLRESRDLEGTLLQDVIPVLETAVENSLLVPVGSKAAGEPRVESPQPPAGNVDVAVRTGNQRSPGGKKVFEGEQLGSSSSLATVRVPAAKLDRLMAKNSELLVARRRIESREEQLQRIQEKLAACRAEWREVETPLIRFLKNDDHSQPEISLRQPHRTATVIETTKTKLQELEKEIESLAGNMMSDGRLLGQTCDALDDEVHRVRMLPFRIACEGLDRAVRDLARTTGKQVSLEIEGESVEVDRSVLEALKDPLLHLVRNAVDHGIETPAERIAMKKTPQATVTISALLRGTRMEVVVSDDGRGINIEQVRQHARKLGLPVPEDDQDVARLIFHAGFSTAAKVSDVSGRGVGLDVVKDRLESLHGAVEVETQPNQGVQFTLTMPLTLTSLRTMLVRASEETYAILTSSIDQVVRIKPKQVGKIAGQEVLLSKGPPIPIYSLAATLGENVLPVEREKLYGVIVATKQTKVVFIVDEILSEQEVVVKNLGSRIRRLRHVSGATLLPSGRIALVLNVTNLVQTALKRDAAIVGENVASPSLTKQRLLVVDDSITSRTLIKSILESSGFQVHLAIDGVDAMEKLRQLDIDLVVSDVDMPKKDGFELTREIRKTPEFSKLPVVLVTGRENEEDRRQGFDSGANAYLVKSRFDQANLLDAIARFI